MKNIIKITILNLALIALISVNSITSFAINDTYLTIKDPISDIKITNGFFKDLNDAQTHFINARKQDSSVKPELAGTLFPNNFSNLTWQEQYITLLNQERTIRGLLPINQTIDILNQISTKYSQDLISSNQFIHTLNNTTPQSRMRKIPWIRMCSDFHPYSESLFQFRIFGTLPMDYNRVGLMGLYNFLYNDSSSQWGHRHHLVSNFINDNKSPEFEGHNGLGIAEISGSELRNGVMLPTKKFILTHNSFDPVSNCTL
jgi:hypothetical protein